MERVSFDIDGTPIVGHLHMPATKGRHPAVITGGPMTSVKEQVTGTYAAALAERGIAALAIDHRHFGASGGSPRQYEFYPHKIEDLKRALNVLATHPAIAPDRLGAVGVCLGAGYLAHAIKEIGRAHV